MTIQELHYDFKLKANRIDTSVNTDFNPAQIDWLLNEAQLIFIKQRFTTSNNKKRGFETTKKRVEDLASLIIKYPTQPELTPLKLSDNVYETRLNELTFEYMFFIDGQVNISLSNDCIKWVPLKFMQHQEYLNALRDPYNNPSEEFIPFNFGFSTKSNALSTDTSIFMYTNYPINKIRVEYLRKPTPVSTGTYQYIDGIARVPNSLEVPIQAHSEVVDIAVQLAAVASTNIDFLKLSTQKTLINE